MAGERRGRARAAVPNVQHLPRSPGPDPQGDKVRAAAQLAWGAPSDHKDVLVTPEPVEKVRDGYWVKARLWVPDAWVKP